MGLLDKVKSLLSGNKVDLKQRYELLREAVSGTMSKFYMARDRETDRHDGIAGEDPHRRPRGRRHDRSRRHDGPGDLRREEPVAEGQFHQKLLTTFTNTESIVVASVAG